jgi:hypothetical protein
MGMEQTITFPVGSPPSWLVVRDLLVSRGFPVQVRMIDGELAFPDEEPPESWRELRLSSPEGRMVTVRREGDRLVLVVWGNADAQLVHAWNALTWAFAEVANGTIQAGDGLLVAAEYMRRMDMPAALNKSPESRG